MPYPISSMPYPISLTLDQIKGLFDESKGMDTDCFNMGVRMLVSNEVQLLKKTGKKVSKHYMDMRFCVSSIYVRECI